MSDQPNTTPEPNELDSLVSLFEAGAEGNLDSSEASEWLEARSSLAARYSELSQELKDRLEKADGEAISRSNQLAKIIAESGQTLAERRSAAAHPAEEWWWNLDILSPISNFYAPKIDPAVRRRNQLFNNLFTAFQVIVLLVALVLLARNLNLFPAPVPPTRTPVPTSTPGPTATLDPGASDMSTAADVATANNVITLKLPKSWTSSSQNTANTANFSYGDPSSPTAQFIVRADLATEIYKDMQLSPPPASSKDALTAYRSSLTTSNPGLQIADIAPAKLGTLTGYGMDIDILGQTGTVDGKAFVRLVDAPGGLVWVIAQGSAATWDQMKPTVEAILDTLVVNIGNIPTATPTATLHPLLMTATAVQTQILGLTPTATFTMTPTPTPGAASTSEATSAATVEAPAAPTTAPTAVPPTKEAPTAAPTTEPTASN